MGVSSSKSNTSENPQVVAARRRELLVSAVNREQIHNPEDVKIDYLMVAMTWPSLFACASVNKGQTDICREKIVTSDFSLHGVWPSVNSGAIFECTFGENFDYGKIAQLEPKLNQHWHDYKIQNPGSHFLYSHEWSAHGKCATVLPEFDSQFKYFDSALNIFSHIPLLKALEQNGIQPGQQVDKQVFKEALASAGIKNSILQCYKNALVEIRTCVTKEPTGENNQHDFIVCPNVRGDSCASSFLFPDPKNDYDDMDF